MLPVIVIMWSYDFSGSKNKFAKMSKIVGLANRNSNSERLISFVLRKGQGGLSCHNVTEANICSGYQS